MITAMGQTQNPESRSTLSIARRAGDDEKLLEAREIDSGLQDSSLEQWLVIRIVNALDCTNSQLLRVNAIHTARDHCISLAYLVSFAQV